MTNWERDKRYELEKRFSHEELVKFAYAEAYAKENEYGSWECSAAPGHPVHRLSVNCSTREFAWEEAFEVVWSRANARERILGYQWPHSEPSVTAPEHPVAVENTDIAIEDPGAPGRSNRIDHLCTAISDRLSGKSGLDRTGAWAHGYGPEIMGMIREVLEAEL